MEKLTIKELAPYLPYNLDLIFEKSGRIITMQSCYNDGSLKITDIGEGNTYDLSIYNFKPILRPLSNLTKEIEHNGEMFVPAGKMITHGFHNKYWYETEKFDYRYLYTMDLEKLLSWHFNVFNLSDHLYIDINTLNQ